MMQNVSGKIALLYPNRPTFFELEDEDNITPAAPAAAAAAANRFGPRPTGRGNFMERVRRYRVANPEATQEEAIAALKGGVPYDENLGYGLYRR